MEYCWDKGITDGYRISPGLAYFNSANDLMGGGYSGAPFTGGSTTGFRLVRNG